MRDRLSVTFEGTKDLVGFKVVYLDNLVGSTGQNDIAIGCNVEGSDPRRLGSVLGWVVAKLGVFLDGIGVGIARCRLALPSYRRQTDC
jgi:hypothetical protein